MMRMKNSESKEMETPNKEKELEGVIDLFISSSDGEVTERHDNHSKEPHRDPYARNFVSPPCDIEETITVNKKMGFHDSRETQNHIKRVLFEYLDQQYKITEIKLIKSVDVIEPGHIKKKNEEIIIYLKNQKNE